MEQDPKQPPKLEVIQPEQKAEAKTTPFERGHFTLQDLQEELNFTRSAMRILREKVGAEQKADLERDVSAFMASLPAEIMLYIVNKTKVVTLRELIQKLRPDYQEIKILDDMKPANPLED